MSKINYKYIHDPNYNPSYINGAYGGLNAQGEIIVHFYLERIAIPKIQSIELEETGKLNPEKTEYVPEDLKNSFVRFIDTGVVMNINTAKDVINWLQKQVESYELLVEQTKSE